MVEAKLIVLNGPNKDDVHTVAQRKVCTLGRGTQADVRIFDSRVSRLQCKFEYRGDHWIVEDLGSSNGTFVNGRVISAAQLKHGDRVRIGKTSLEFRSEEAEAPQPEQPQQEPAATEQESELFSLLRNKDAEDSSGTRHDPDSAQTEKQIKGGSGEGSDLFSILDGRRKTAGQDTDKSPPSGQ